jgi:predicted membrane protein
MGNFDTSSSLAIILLAAVVHASFQLSVSVLTLLSGHALGRNTAHHRLLRLTSGFILGAGVMTILLLSSFAFVLSQLLQTGTPLILWAIVCGAVVGVGISIWLFYYRGERGTSLWIPRGFAQYLGSRSKSSKDAAEAFGLGLGSVFAELLFVFAPILIAALVLIRLTPEQQLLGVLLYSIVSLLPLILVGVMIGGGHKLSHIQRWRESNKGFLQFAAGSGLLILGAYVYVERVVVTTVAAMGVQ